MFYIFSKIRASLLLLTIIAGSLLVAQPAFALAATATATASAPTSLNLCSLVNPGVRAVFLPQATKVVAGKNLSLAGTIWNSNQYPIPDVTIVARIVKLPKKLGSIYDTATDTVARIMPLDNLSLNASSSATFAFTWQVPADLMSGPYRVDLYLNEAGQFAVGGNETLGMPLASYPILVSGTETHTSFFAAPTAQVNGTLVGVDGLATVSGTQTALVMADVLNTYAAPYADFIAWSVYQGNVISNQALVATGTEAVSLSPKAKTPVSFDFTSLTHSHYIIVGDLTDGNKHSLLSIRINRTDIVEPTFRSIFLSPFPLVAGQSVGVAGCFTQNFSAASSSPTVVTSVMGADGLTLYSNSIQANQAPLFQFQSTFVPSTDLNQAITLNVKTVDASGNTSASASVPYTYSSVSAYNAVQNPLIVWMFYAISFFAALVALIFTAFLPRKKKNLPPPYLNM